MTIEAMKQMVEGFERLALFKLQPDTIQNLTDHYIGIGRQAIAEAEKQEPVAYSYTSRITGAQGFSHHPLPRFIDSESWGIKPLYTSPPQRQWVGLTDEDVYPLANEHLRYQPEDYEVSGVYDLARAIEAKLKEKNT